MRVLGYRRVSTREQGISGLGMEAQTAACETDCSRRGWDFPVWEEDVVSSGKEERPGLARALTRMQGHEADVLMVSKLDRLGRSTHEVSGFIERAAKEDWLLVCISPAVDMSTPYGRAMAQMACVFAELERELIRARTRDAMLALRERGQLPGPRAETSEQAETVIASMAAEGPVAIARALDAMGIAAPRGGGWNHQTVRRALARQAFTADHERKEV